MPKTTCTFTENKPQVRREDYYYPGSLWAWPSQGHVYILVKGRDGGFALLRFDYCHQVKKGGWKNTIEEAVRECEPFTGTLTITMK